MRAAKELVELYNLINKSDFRHKLWEISFSDLEIDFKTRNTLCGTYLSGKILFDSNHYIVYNYVGYEDVKIPISKVTYGIKVKNELIANLSDTLLRLLEFSDFANKRFKGFEEHSIPRSTRSWKQEFIGELKDLFGSPRTVILASGIKLIVAFEEETNLIKIVLAKGLFFDEEKTLLHGIVSETNYKEVLDIVENIYTDFKYKFYDVDGIVEELKHLDY